MVLLITHLFELLLYIFHIFSMPLHITHKNEDDSLGWKELKDHPVPAPCLWERVAKH